MGTISGWNEKIPFLCDKGSFPITLSSSTTTTTTTRRRRRKN
jgi:hypothetical protein